MIIAAAACCTAALAEERQTHAEALAHSANAFLDTLSERQRSEALLEFDDENRLDWHYFPRSRQGISWRGLEGEASEAAHALLKTALSEQGYEKAQAIRMLELILYELENNPARNIEDFYITVFNEPKARGAWGLRYEGHHLSFNWTIVDGAIISYTPQFLGANPAAIRHGERKGERTLAAEEDLARSLVQSFNTEQREQAIAAERPPRDILTGARTKASPLPERGIAWKDLTEDQQGLLISIIELYASVQPEPIAAQRLAKLREAGLDSLTFTWMGGLEPSQPHYYRIQAPSFVIEYDNTQGGANHIHTVWREFEGDFGRDILAEHYARHHLGGNTHSFGK